MKLLENRVLVRRNDIEEKTSGGIFLIDSAQKYRCTGKVVAIGEDTNKKFLNKSIIFDPVAGSNFEYNGTSHLMIFEPDIRAII